MSGDLDGAMDDFQACSDSEGGAPDALYEMALIHEYRGELQLAVDLLSRVRSVADGPYRDTEERLAALAARLDH